MPEVRRPYCAGSAPVISARLPIEAGIEHVTEAGNAVRQK